MLLLLLLSFAARADDFVVVVFDTSGSMSERMRKVSKTRMAVAQEALIDVLGKVPPTTKVGLLTFDGWKYDLQPVDQSKLSYAIKQCVPSGGTPLYLYMKDGADRLLAERAKQLNVGSYKLLVVTDGQASDGHFNEDGKWRDGELKPGYLRDIVGRGIVVDAIGLDMREDHLLKSQINGFYTKGDDLETLKAGLARGVAEVKFGPDSGGDEFFAELEQVPDLFVKNVVAGLSDLPNHPIGERAPVRVMKDGVLTYEKHPDAVPYEGTPWYVWTLIVFAVIGCGFVVFIIIGNRR